MSMPTAAVEADLAALRGAAERAGCALACLFSSADEYEADLIRERRAQGRYRRPSRFGVHARHALLSFAVALAFLLM
jgi:hypothetical protein